MSTVPSAALSLALGMRLRVEANYESAILSAAAPAPFAAAVPGPLDLSQGRAARASCPLRQVPHTSSRVLVQEMAHWLPEVFAFSLR